VRTSRPMPKTIIWSAVALLALALGVACGGPQDPATENLTAAEHEAEAEREEAAAAEHEGQYDPDARLTTGGQQPGTDLYYGTDHYNPTEVHLHAADDHREHAGAHRERAAQLRDFAEAECAEFPPETRASCPLLLGLVEVEDIEAGIRMTFASAQDLAPVVDHIRCHIAFAAAMGNEGMDHCALYVHGASVDVEGTSVDLITDQPGFVAELRRRVRVQAP